MELDVSILEYLGKIEGGIIVLLSISYNNEFFEGTFFYNKEDIILTISEELEELIGDIKKHSEYLVLVKKILKSIVPYNEIIDRIDDLDLKKWVDVIEKQHK